MLDDDDLDFVILSSDGRATGWFGLILGVLGLCLIVVIAILVVANHDECDKRHCPDGQRPKLLKSECLCVTEATK